MKQLEKYLTRQRLSETALFACRTPLRSHVRPRLWTGVVVGMVVAWQFPCVALASPPGTWSPSEHLAVARSRHTATLLADGTVLVAGGLTGTLSNIGTTAAAELYDPDTGTWQPTSTMATPRSRHTATVLATGEVLVVGGRIQLGFAGTSLATAELYDPDTGTWRPTGSLAIARDSHTATLLSDGRVLVAGGLSAGANGNPVEKTAEIYDPTSGTWSPADHMAIARFGHAATALADGGVLVTGGSGPRGDGVYTMTAEIYDPKTDQWTSTAPMSTPRGFHIAVSLFDGRVLVAGGYTLPANEVQRTATAEVYDPTTGSWNPTRSMATARAAYDATVLDSERVLVVGGRTATAELYDPLSAIWTSAGSMTVSRNLHTVTLLTDGRVLIAGGENSSGFLATAEVYTP